MILVSLVGLGLLVFTQFEGSQQPFQPSLFGDLAIVAEIGSGKDVTLIAAASLESARSIDEQVRSSDRLQSGHLLIYRGFREVSMAKPLAIYDHGQPTLSDAQALQSTQPLVIGDFKKQSRSGAYCQDGVHSKATGSGACSHHGGVRTWTHKPEVAIALVCNGNRLVAGPDEDACQSNGVALRIKNKHLTDFTPAAENEN